MPALLFPEEPFGFSGSEALDEVANLRRAKKVLKPGYLISF